MRRTLPPERPAITKRFELRYVDTDPAKTKRVLKLYLTAGMHEDQTLGEIFIKAEDRRVDGEDHSDENRSATMPLTVGALDALAMTISVGLQHGVPLSLFVEKLRHNRFGPNGYTGDDEIHSYTSVFDLIAQWLNLRFPDGKLAVQRGREP